MPTFVDKDCFFNFFTKEELLFYKDEKDIISQINKFNNPKQIYKIGKKVKKDFDLFNNLIISDLLK